MSPNVRRAMHEALDLVLDALAQDAREKPAAVARRVRPQKVRELPPGVSDATIERARKAGIKAGLL